MSPGLLFVVSFVAVFTTLRALARGGTPAVASGSLLTKVPRTATRVVCWAVVVNTSAISAYAIASSPAGEAGRTLKMVAILLLLGAAVPVLVLRRLRVPASSRRRTPAPGSYPHQGANAVPPVSQTQGLAGRLRDYTTRPVDGP